MIKLIVVLIAIPFFFVYPPFFYATACIAAVHYYLS